MKLELEMNNWRWMGRMIFEHEKNPGSGLEDRTRLQARLM